MMPQLFTIGIQLTRERATSAMPHAPVVDDTPAAPRLRRGAARALRRVADRMDT
jgi:hypothetical protein